MAIPFKTYIKVKENYCIGYFGLKEDYLRELFAARPLIENCFPGLKIYIAYNDKLSFIAESKYRVVPYSLLECSLVNFGCFLQLQDNLTDNPVDELLKECGVVHS